MRRTFIVLCALGFVTGCSSVKRINPVTLRDLTPDERTLLTTIFATAMKDAETVQLKWNRIGPPDEKGVTEYCAMIDAKNDYGNYVGFQPFVAQVLYAGTKIISAKMILVGFDPTSAQEVDQDCKAHGIDPHTAI
jgi:hypothetical protein